MDSDGVYMLWEATDAPIISSFSNPHTSQHLLASDSWYLIACILLQFTQTGTIFGSTLAVQNNETFPPQGAT